MAEAKQVFQTSRKQEGVLLAFMGLPGSGKSTTAKALSELIVGSRVFLEPNERLWPPAVTGRHRYGYFTALTWFRSMRIPLLYLADDVRCSGGIAIVDSYYDKLIAGYLDDPDMRWLMPRDDFYYSIAKGMAELDWAELPDADCVIFLRVTVASWRQLLSTQMPRHGSGSGVLTQFPYTRTVSGGHVPLCIAVREPGLGLRSDV